MTVAEWTEARESLLSHACHLRDLSTYGVTIHNPNPGSRCVYARCGDIIDSALDRLGLDGLCGKHRDRGVYSIIYNCETMVIGARPLSLLSEHFADRWVGAVDLSQPVWPVFVKISGATYAYLYSTHAVVGPIVDSEGSVVVEYALHINEAVLAEAFAF